MPYGRGNWARKDKMQVCSFVIATKDTFGCKANSNRFHPYLVGVFLWRSVQIRVYILGLTRLFQTSLDHPTGVAFDCTRFHASLTEGLPVEFAIQTAESGTGTDGREMEEQD
eukprot:TRINITY_DN6560_c1_g1_i4.p3 TRINITY_DN6560_c1_g1~~TRINITY_DN6560_c1_g1_i4.p3  ORF type:complete len:112 (+),score=14.63 TRINITY_DN6560_c1_g1_i4:394-729(+)